MRGLRSRRTQYAYDTYQQENVKSLGNPGLLVYASTSNLVLQGLMGGADCLANIREIIAF